MTAADEDVFKAYLDQSLRVKVCIIFSPVFCTPSFFIEIFQKRIFEQTQEIGLEILGPFSDNSS